MPWGVHLLCSARIGTLDGCAADGRPRGWRSTRSPGQAQRSALREEAADCCCINDPLYPFNPLSDRLQRQDADCMVSIVDIRTVLWCAVPCARLMT